METLTRYIHGKTKLFNDEDSGHSHEPSAKTPVDVNVALKIIGRRPYRRYERERVNMWGLVIDGVDLDGSDLSDTDFSYARLSNASLIGVNFRDACLAASCLRRAFLTDADARDCSFFAADLKYAYFLDAKLDRADLSGADLRYAMIGDGRPDPEGPASLKGTQMHKAKLKGAELKGLDLRNVVGLTQEQINSAIIDDATQLPAGLSHPKAKEIAKSPNKPVSQAGDDVSKDATN